MLFQKESQTICLQLVINLLFRKDEMIKMKRKFSRSIAALLSATMVLSVGVTSVFAAETTFFESACDNTTGMSANASNATIVSVDGLKGKSTTDKVILLTELNGNRYNGYFAMNNYQNYGKYIVCEINALSTGTDIVFRGNGGRVVGQSMNLTDGNWHKVLWCIDTENVTEVQTWNKTVPVYTYIDGVKQTGTTVDLAAIVDTSGTGELLTYTTTKSMNVRLGLDNVAKTKNATGYFDDIKVYTTDTLPADSTFEAATAPTALTGVTNATVATGKLNVSGDVTLNDILAANSGTTVRAYTNSAMTNQVANTAKLKTGNVIVTENAANKALEYYTVDKGDGYRSIIETADGDLTADGGALTFTKVRLTESKETSRAGKSAEDASVILTHSGSGSNDAEKTNMYISTGYKRQDNEKYLVFEANVILHDKVGTTDGCVVVRQNSHKAMSAAVKGIQDGKWHKVLFYLDMTDTTALKSKMFVDGTEYGIGYPSNEAESIADNTTDMNFRFCFEGGSSTMVARIDDISFYATNALPTAAQTAPTALNAASGMMVGKNSININESSNVTLNAIKAANTNVAARAYTDSTMTVAVADDATLAEGNVVVTENADNGALKYYNVDLKAETVSVTGNVSSNTVSGAITATPDFSDENNIVVVAQYSDNVLIKAAVSASKNAAVTFTPNAVANSKIRIFAFNSLANIKPFLDAALEYTYSAAQ